MTSSLERGTAGLCNSRSTCGGGGAWNRELTVPGVPRFSGTSRRMALPTEWSQVWAMSRGVPETHRASKLSVTLVLARRLVTSISTRLG